MNPEHDYALLEIMVVKGSSNLTKPQPKPYFTFNRTVEFKKGLGSSYGTGGSIYNAEHLDSDIERFIEGAKESGIPEEYITVKWSEGAKKLYEQLKDRKVIPDYVDEDWVLSFLNNKPEDIWRGIYSERMDFVVWFLEERGKTQEQIDRILGKSKMLGYTKLYEWAVNNIKSAYTHRYQLRESYRKLMEMKVLILLEDFEAKEKGLVGGEEVEVIYLSSHSGKKETNVEDTLKQFGYQVERVKEAYENAKKYGEYIGILNPPDISWLDPLLEKVETAYKDVDFHYITKLVQAIEDKPKEKKKRKKKQPKLPLVQLHEITRSQPVNPRVPHPTYTEEEKKDFNKEYNEYVENETKKAQRQLKTSKKPQPTDNTVQEALDEMAKLNGKKETKSASTSHLPVQNNEVLDKTEADVKSEPAEKKSPFDLFNELPDNSTKEEEVENIPCEKCGRKDLPLHYNKLCPECFEIPEDKIDEKETQVSFRNMPSKPEALPTPEYKAEEVLDTTFGKGKVIDVRKSTVVGNTWDYLLEINGEQKWTHISAIKGRVKEVIKEGVPDGFFPNRGLVDINKGSMRDPDTDELILNAPTIDCWGCEEQLEVCGYPFYICKNDHAFNKKTGEKWNWIPTDKVYHPLLELMDESQRLYQRMFHSKSKKREHTEANALWITLSGIGKAIYDKLEIDEPNTYNWGKDTLKHHAGMRFASNLMFRAVENRKRINIEEDSVLPVVENYENNADGYIQEHSKEELTNLLLEVQHSWITFAKPKTMLSGLDSFL